MRNIISIITICAMLASSAAFAAYEQTPFAIVKGGTGTASAPSSAQILVAQSATAYAPFSMSGGATMSASGVVTLTNSAVTGQLLTGFSAGAGTVSASDSILQGFNKLAGNQAGFANTALSNLASVAINTGLVPATNNSIQLGSSTIGFLGAQIQQFIAPASGTISFTGDTHGTTTVDNITSTAGIYAGMYITGASDIPKFNFITAVGANSVTLKFPATGTNAGESLFAIPSLTVKASDQSGGAYSGYQALRSGNVATAGSGFVVMRTGDSTSGYTGPVHIKSGDSSAGGLTGDINIAVGSTSGTQGQVNVSGAQINLNSPVYIQALSGVLKATAGLVSVASPGTDYLTVLSGDVTTSGNVATIANSAVTNAKMANMANNTVKSNISGGSAAPSDNSLSAIMDAVFGNAQGDILYRNASGWVVLAPGTSGYFLQTQGAGANPQWSPDTESAVNVVNGGNAPYTIGATDDHVRSGTTLTADRAYTLPACVANIGEKHEVKNLVSQSFNIILTGNGSDNIDAANTLTIYPGDSIPVICAVSGQWDIE